MRFSQLKEPKMKEKRCSIILIAFMSLLFFGCTTNNKMIKLATYTYATNDRVENMRLLSRELENDLRRHVEITSYPDVESLIAAIKSNEIDVAFINTLGYLLLSSDNEHMLPVVNLHIRSDAKDNYKTVFLTKNGRINDYLEIKKRAQDLTMMFVKEGSTSGNLVPRLFLSAIGISNPEFQFKKVEYGGNHTATFEKLRKGETDLCAIGSNEFYEQIKMDSTLESEVKLLWISDEIPLGPVLVNKQLSEKDREHIVNLLLNLHTEHLDAFKAIKSGWSEAKQADKFQSISDEYYDSFRKVNGNKTHLNEILELIEK